MTKEERIKRAREKMEKLRKATKTRSRTDRMDWRPKAKVVLHPDTDIVDRLRVWFPKEVEVKEKEGEGEGKRKRDDSKRKPKVKVVTVPYNVSNDPKEDPFAKLRKMLKEDKSIDAEDIVISVGSGRNKVDLCKGEILGWEGYNFRKRLVPQSDFVCVAVMVEDSKGNRPPDLKAEILSGAKSLGNDIRKEIESEIDESGEEEGNPFITPYPFILTFDENEQGTDMYSARARPQEAKRLEKDSKLMAILDAEPPDLDDEIKLDDPDAMCAVLNAAIVLDDFEVEVDAATFKKPKEEESKGGKSKRAKDGDDDQGEDDQDQGDNQGEDDQDQGEDDQGEEEKEEEPPPKVERRTRRKKEEPKEEKSKRRAKKEEPKEEKKLEKKTERKPREKKVKEEAPSKKLGWTPGEGEDYDICPKCREPVPQDAIECPHPDCDAKYAPDDGSPF